MMHLLLELIYYLFRGLIAGSQGLIEAFGLRTAKCPDCGAGVYAEEREAAYAEERTTKCCWLCGTRIKPGADKCPDCGAGVYPEEQIGVYAKERKVVYTEERKTNRCRLCGMRIEPLSESRLAESMRPFDLFDPTYGLSTLMIMVALAAVLFGVYREWPGWAGILLAIVTPGLAATVVMSLKRRIRGHPMTGWQKLATFATAVGVVAASAGVLTGMVVLAVVVLRISVNNCWNTGHC